MQRLKAVIEMVSTLAVIAAAGVLIWNVGFRQPARASMEPPAPTDATGTIAKERLRNVVGDGPIALIEFTDFQCPFCARHATVTVPALRKALIDTGQARYAVVNFPLTQIHAQAIPAAEAAECAAEQGKYWEMHDLLFANQQGLSAGTDYRRFAEDVWLDDGRFVSCLNADAALARVSADLKEAERLGVRATPTLFLGRVRPDGGVDLLRQLNGALPVSTFVAEVTKLTKG